MAVQLIAAKINIKLEIHFLKDFYYLVHWIDRDSLNRFLLTFTANVKNCILVSTFNIVH